MYISKRAIIDTRKYDVREIFFRYKQGKVWFYEKNATAWKKPKKIVREVLWALMRGIPFPPVYASELQTGELLILDKSDKLRFLLEYLKHREENIRDFREEDDMYFTKDVMYSPIILYVIDYMNPKYMHMQIGKFVEEWTPTQEQSIWDILYRKEGADKLKEMVKVIRPSGRANLTLEYNLLYFIMSDFWVKGLLLSYQSEESEKFQLLENTMNEMKYRKSEELEEIFDEFITLYFVAQQGVTRNYVLKSKNTEERMKYLCFMHMCKVVEKDFTNYRIFELKEIQNKVENCDMSYNNIKRTFDFIERKI